MQRPFRAAAAAGQGGRRKEPDVAGKDAARNSGRDFAAAYGNNLCAVAIEYRLDPFVIPTRWTWPQWFTALAFLDKRAKQNRRGRVNGGASGGNGTKTVKYVDMIRDDVEKARGN